MSGPSLTKTTGVVVVSVAAGLLVASSSRLGLVLDGLGIGTLLLVISARVLAPPRPRNHPLDLTAWSSEPSDSAVGARLADSAPSYAQTARDSGFRVARGLFMVGMASLGASGVRLGHALTVSDAFFVFSAMSAALEATVTRRWVRPGLPRGVYAGAFVLILGGLLTSVTLPHPGASLSVVLRLAYLTLVWFGTAALVLTSPAQVERALRWWVFGLAVSGAFALLQFATGSGLVATSAGARVLGLSNHPNYLGDSLAIGFVPALVFCLRSFDSDRAVVKLYNAGVLGLLGIGIMLSGSLEGFLAMVVATVFWLLVAPPTAASMPRLAAMFAAGTLVVVVALAFSGHKSANIFTRLGISHSSDQSPSYSLNLRVSGYKLAIQSIERQPLVGIGFTVEGQATALNDEAVHNMFIRSWYEGGVISFLGLLMIFAATFALFRRRLLDHRGDGGPIAPLTAALLGAMMAYLVAAMSAPILFARIGWVVVALLIPLRPPLRNRPAQHDWTGAPLQSDPANRAPAAARV